MIDVCPICLREQVPEHLPGSKALDTGPALLCTAPRCGWAYVKDASGEMIECWTTSRSHPKGIYAETRTEISVTAARPKTPRAALGT